MYNTYEALNDEYGNRVGESQYIAYEVLVAGNTVRFFAYYDNYCCVELPVQPATAGFVSGTFHK